MVGDRAFIFAFGNAEPSGSVGWVSKRHSVTMLNTPYLAWIESGWDPEARVLSVTVKGQTKSANVDDAVARLELSEWMTDVVLGLPENPLRGRPEREPLRLLGDGEARFTDRGPTQISLGGLASLGDLSAKAGVDVDMRRFRLNSRSTALTSGASSIGWASGSRSASRSRLTCRRRSSAATRSMRRQRVRVGTWT